MYRIAKKRPKFEKFDMVFECQHPIIQAEWPLKFIPGSSFSNHTIAFEQIAELDHAETQLRARYEQGELTTEEFMRVRTQEQSPRLAAMKALLIAKQGQSPPSLAFGNAVSYARGQWERIEQ